MATVRTLRSNEHNLLSSFDEDDEAVVGATGGRAALTSRASGDVMRLERAHDAHMLGVADRPVGLAVAQLAAPDP